MNSVYLQVLLVFFGCIVTFVLGLIAWLIKRGLDKYDNHRSVQQQHANTLGIHDAKLIEHTEKIKEHGITLEKHSDTIHKHGERISTIEAQI